MNSGGENFKATNIFCKVLDATNLTAFDAHITNDLLVDNVLQADTVAVTNTLSVAGQLTDQYSSPGTAGQVLSSDGVATLWVNPIAGTLQSVTDAGSTTTNDITVASVKFPTITFGSFSSPASPSQLYTVGINRYIFWVSVPAGSTQYDVTALTIGGAAIFETNLSVSSVVNSTGGATTTCTVTPIYAAPSGGDSVIIQELTFSSALAAPTIFKCILHLTFD
jgi:hypothetical protein